ncbi:MAG TPA: pyridoxal-dependent decarboxylase [Streptosporangiaceae bacterium]|jgi:aromatic-L-amino-acid decarboxylase|nr:pyridoxal-dependent decarboxylase [Streptosporangiaceae bacterium]
MQELGQAALDWVTRFVEGLDRAPSDGRSTATPSTATPSTGTQSPDPALREALLAEPREDPSEFGELLALFGAAAAQAIETAGPAYLGYVPGGGLYVSALAEFLARSANRFTGLAATAPELAAMEHGVLRWLCRTFTLPQTAGGLITTGGSMATLSAIVAARRAGGRGGGRLDRPGSAQGPVPPVRHGCPAGPRHRGAARRARR